MHTPIVMVRNIYGPKCPALVVKSLWVELSGIDYVIFVNILVPCFDHPYLRKSSICIKSSKLVYVSYTCVVLKRIYQKYENGATIILFLGSRCSMHKPDMDAFSALEYEEHIRTLASYLLKSFSPFVCAILGSKC